MFLILNAIAASLDGLIIGISLHLSNIYISKKNTLLIFVENLIFYAFFLFLYSYFHLTFMTKTVTTLLYLFLAFNAFNNKEKENKIEEKALNVLSCTLLTITHSLDGAIVSLPFVYQYSIILISFIFGLMSITVLLIGYYFTNYFNKTKKKKYIGPLLFIFLAIINQFL